jgi:hypothetical protein
MEVMMADPNPTVNHRGAFTRGWFDALRVLNHERHAYQEPERNTWQATGYRFGMRLDTNDEETIALAWQWSVPELQQKGYVDVTLFDR